MTSALQLRSGLADSANLPELHIQLSRSQTIYARR